MKIKLMVVLMIIIVITGCVKKHTLNEVWTTDNHATTYLKKLTKIKLNKKNGKTEAHFYTKNFGKQSCVDKNTNRSTNLKFFCQSDFLNEENHTRVSYNLSLFKPVIKSSECDIIAYEKCQGNKKCFCVKLRIGGNRGGGPEDEVGVGGNNN